jgi:hypothetical protein
MNKTTITLPAETEVSWQVSLAGENDLSRFTEGLPPELVALIACNYSLYVLSIPAHGVELTMQREVWDPIILEEGYEIPSKGALEFIKDQALTAYLTQGTDIVNPTGSVVMGDVLAVGVAVMNSEAVVYGYPDEVNVDAVADLERRITASNAVGALQE